MKRILFGVISVGLMAVTVGLHPALADGKKSWTFRGSFSPAETWESKVIYVPNGRYKVTASSDSFPCPPDGGEYCVAGQSQACVNEVQLVRAPGNRGFSTGIYRPRNTPNPASPLSDTIMHDNVGGNGKYYIEVSDGSALNDLPTELAVAGFQCAFKVTLKKIG